MKASFEWLLAVAALCAAQGASAAAPAAAAPARPALEKQDIRAQLAPRRFTTVAAEIGAKVSRVAVAEGSAFRAGQVLVSFDCSLQQAQLQKAKAVLGAAERTFSANKRLDELNSVGKVELQASEAELGKARADVAANTVLLSKCAIPAPFSGRVAEQKVREQQYVQPGQALLEILDDSVLELEFLVPSRWLAWVKPGYAFQVRIDETGKTYPAKVQRIGARVDPVSQSIKLSAAIDGRFPELIAGMSGRVALTAPAGQ
ncbi:efflux RND transporter periplasmic adaptor subunit [Herbaspirillum sp. SJZ107]|uniref:efflux RND transporter periplasmic adaptor subunit n=1 Tax=Herbaspirillum sp. SJZ107 TaxID=2572881 RepID=UPI00115034EF|nr:efflux RND transporter periplasmic adaptor subunit [Herbaspirillum sp. SJZ107]TQK04777.1 RND family efflux transporter MFP subunit [Herbaspirillum sp. SJZ107]